MMSNSQRDEFQLLADTIPQLVWTTDPRGFHDYFNHRWTEYTGFDPHDSAGTEVWNRLLHPEDQERARRVWNASLESGDFYEIEYRFRRHDGEYRWFLGQARPVRDADGRIVKWFGTCTDIHERKVLVERLERREAEFSALADNIHQLAWMAEPSGAIYWYNRRWFEFTGTTLEAARGWGWQAVHHPDHVARVTERIQRCFAEGRFWEDTFPLRGRDGAYRWFLSRAVPIRDEHGAVIRWFGTNTDITEQRDLQDQLQRAYDDLEVKVTFRNLDLERQLREQAQQIAALQARLDER